MTTVKYICLSLACVCLVYAAPAHALNIGDPFPEFTVANTLSPEHSAYLKVPHVGQLALKSIPHEVIILEFINVYCHTCRMQVSIFNELKKAIAADPDLRGKVCLLGFAVGNSPEEIATFVDDFGVQYPILSDQDKAVFTSTGNIRGTPQTYIIRRDGRGFIVDYHAGGVSSPERYLDSLRYILRSSLIGTQPGNRIPDIEFKASGETISTRSLTGTRYLLYFASSVVRDVELDLRNMGMQLNVLHAVAEGGAVKIFVFLPPDCESGTQPIAEPLVLAQDKDHAIRALLGSKSQPVVLFINEFGRIAYKDESITGIAATELIEGRDYKPEPAMSRQDIQDLIRLSVAAVGHTVVEIESLMLENRQELFVITVAPQGSGVFLFARVESGITMCDVCHDTHFVYLFDQNGVVVDFIPLALTKYGNVEWNDDDIKKMKHNLVDRNIFEPFPFNPAVDAVSTATMTSSMIYEAMNRARIHFKDFYEYRFREGHWKNVCFSVICKVKALIKARKSDTGFVLDDSALQTIMSENGLRGCPTGGMYIVLDGDVLCSQHGLNVQGCAQ